MSFRGKTVLLWSCIGTTELVLYREIKCTVAFMEGPFRRASIVSIMYACYSNTTLLLTSVSYLEQLARLVLSCVVNNMHG